jgi:RNA polymerase sigma-B factor
MKYAESCCDVGVAQPDREQRIEEYRYLCRRGARKFARRYEDRADLEQVAAIGLIKAADRYRAEMNTPFEAYAWIMIQGELLHYVRDHERPIRAPRRLRDLDRRWRAARDELTQCLEREPLDSEVSRYLSIDPAVAQELCEYRERGSVASLDALPPSRAYYTIDVHDEHLALELALRRLNDVERSIVTATLQHDISVAEVALKLGYSARHVSRLRKSALKKIFPFCV